MDNDRWNKINEVFSASVELEKEEQNRFLAEACGADEALRKEVQLLLDAHLQADDFIETPVFADAVQALNMEEDLFKIDQQIGAYKILKEIGRGGMGAVYLAARADQEYKKLVAIKLIKRGMDTEQVLHRFRNERQILANFDHPNIARLLEGGSTSNGLPYFVMEYVEGRPLDLYCDENNLSVTKRLELFRQVCSAVSYAHRNLVVHRDIKPSNILITPEGLPKLLDFGIAKILQPHSGERTTATGFMPMTPEYASPEQALGANVTTYSDIYSLGVLLYELLSGHLPYQLQQASPMEVARIITETRPPLPSTIVNTVVADRTPETVSKSREGTPDRLRRRLRGDLDNIVLMAMRKEPERRYQSVEQFSEDIRRHLEGHPVLARKDTFLYRGTKFVKRNRMAAAFAILALLSISIAGMIRWRTNQQAASFQEFGQEATRMEAIMRYAYLLPLHDTQTEKTQVVQRLEQIRKRMQTLGKIAYGPGYYSIGRGYLALHRYQDAYENLILAWQEHNYRETFVASSLGLTLAMLYQEKLHEAEGLYDREDLSLQKAELEKNYRDPALKYIQYGASASEDPEYVKALIAFLEKRYKEALEQTKIAEHKTSWLYEGKLLQGHIFKEMGSQERDTGKPDRAAKLYDQAKTAYVEAARKGQSDPQVYEGLCSLQSAIQEMEVSQKGSSSEQLLKEGITHCQKALQADSKNINANLYASLIYTEFAYSQYLHGIDCAASVETSANFARAILKIDPENGLAHQAFGNAYKILGAAKMQWGQDPHPSFKLASDSLEKATTKIPNNAELWSNLGANYINIAHHFNDSGKDPIPPLDRAIVSLNKAIELSPRHSRYRTNLGIAYSYKGSFEKAVAVDPRKSYKEAIIQLKKSIEINPAFVNAYVWAGLTTLQLAYSQLDHGENPLATIEESLALRYKALSLDPQNTYAYMGIGACYTTKARFLMTQQKDPTRDLDSAREGYQKSLSLNNKIYMTYRGLAEIELLAARNAVAHKTSPEAFLIKADRYLKSTLELSPDSWETLQFVTHRHLIKAEYFFSLGKSAEQDIRAGIQSIDRSLQLNAKSATAHAYRGKLYLLKAKSSANSSRIRHAREAVTSFDKAFQIHPAVRNEYENDRNEAIHLTQIEAAD